MSKATPRIRHKAPADFTATDTATTTAQKISAHDDGHGLTRKDEPRLRSPQQFYADLTKRSDVRAFLKRLADR